MSVVGPTVSKLWLTRLSWTKLLPKSGPRFDRVVTQMRAVRLPQLAKDYMQLRRCVVNHFLMELTVPAAVEPVSRDTEAGLTSATEAESSTATEVDSSSATESAEDYAIVDPYEREWRDLYFPTHDVVM